MITGKVLKMKFERLNIKHFAELATNNGVFGSAQASLKNEGIKTTDYNQIASMPAFKQGWNSATITAKALPPLEEMQGLESYLSYLINYLYQQGIATWDANYTYYVGNMVAVVDSQTNKVKLYSSLTNNNKGNNPSTDAGNWALVTSSEGLGGLELMDVVFAPLGIDESENKRRYLNGQVLIQSQFPAFTAAVKARMTTMANAFTTEVNWQAEKTNSKLGQCGKFVVDDTAGTIRLPCVVNAQGLVDLALIGGIKSESLPQHTHNLSLLQAAGSIWNVQGAAFWGGDDAIRGPYNATTTNASSSTYQEGAPVQQEAIQYPYCIVVNTGVDEAERPINNYQVNNVYSYGMSQYYKGTMNNNSWLKSAGQWNDGTVYTGMYQWLIEQMNAGVSGYVASTATYTDYDYVVNTTNQTFRLPLLNGDEVIPDWENSQNIASSLPFTSPRNGYIYGDGDGLGSLYFLNGVKVGVARGTSAWRSNGTVSVFVKREDVFNSTADFTGDENFSLSFIPAVGNGNLYYYVGDVLQNAQLINVARIEEKLTDINAASRGYVVESYHNGTAWYRIYSDGWCEQGFPDAIIQEHIVTLPVPMANNTYSVSIGQSGSSASSQVGRSTWKEKTATTLKLSADTLTDWIIAGYKA